MAKAIIWCLPRYSVFEFKRKQMHAHSLVQGDLLGLSISMGEMGAQHVQYDQIAHIGSPVVMMGEITIGFLSNVMWVLQQKWMSI